MTSDVFLRIQQKLSEKRLSARAVSLAAGMSPDAIRDIGRTKRGKTTSPTLDTIQKLSGALSVAPEWLAFGSGDDVNGMIDVPVVSWVSASALSPVDPVEMHADMPTISQAGLPDGDWIALTVDGTSMDRIAPHGALILVNRRERDLISGHCYVIRADGGATFKRYRSGPARFEPVSTDPAHEIIFPQGAVKVIGRARRVLLDI